MASATSARCRWIGSLCSAGAPARSSPSELVDRLEIPPVDALHDPRRRPRAPTRRDRRADGCAAARCRRCRARAAAGPSRWRPARRRRRYRPARHRRTAGRCRAHRSAGRTGSDVGPFRPTLRRARWCRSPGPASRPSQWRSAPRARPLGWPSRPSSGTAAVRAGRSRGSEDSHARPPLTLPSRKTAPASLTELSFGPHLDGAARRRRACRAACRSRGGASGPRRWPCSRPRPAGCRCRDRAGGRR